MMKKKCGLRGGGGGGGGDGAESSENGRHCRLIRQPLCSSGRLLFTAAGHARRTFQRQQWPRRPAVARKKKENKKK